MKLTTKKLGTYWWILGDEDAGPMGPYDSRVEAEDDRVGVTRFYRHCNKPGYVTSETQTDDRRE